MSNRDLATTLITKYAPGYRVVFDLLSSDEIIRQRKGLTDNQRNTIYLDARLIDHASSTAAKIYTIHELGHVFAGYEHDARWHNAVKRLLIAEGLGQYADPKYYQKTTPAALWKLHVRYEANKGRPQWLKL